MRIRIARNNRLRMSAIELEDRFLSVRGLDMKNNTSRTFSSRRTSKEKSVSRSSLVSNGDPKTRQEEMENLNHSDNLKPFDRISKSASFRSNILFSGRSKEENNEDDKISVSPKRKRNYPANSR